MYIWRGKNSRDNRFPDRNGVYQAGRINECFNLGDDDALLLSEENDHVEKAHNNYQNTITDYLNTSEGQSEIKLLRRELGKERLGLQEEKKVVRNWSLFTALRPENLFDTSYLVDACQNHFLIENILYMMDIQIVVDEQYGIL